MAVKIVCDFCDKPLEIEYVDTDFGQAEAFKRCIPKDRYMRKLFRVLCRNCSDKLDLVTDFMKSEWLKEIDISDKNARLNKARREVLGTKG